ncbi:hypothetical protein BD414DRAFT_503893 [Trametes punicea]|nr:hypothetical protein BD414DRAFT_503893 [Trametes punicea]
MAQDLFSTVGLPKLEEFIPDAFFLDMLLVHNPKNLTKHRQCRDTNKPLKYRRVIHPHCESPTPEKP